jgi:hypothetical protein
MSTAFDRTDAHDEAEIRIPIEMLGNVADFIAGDFAGGSGNDSGSGWAP